MFTDEDGVLAKDLFTDELVPPTNGLYHVHRNTQTHASDVHVGEIKRDPSNVHMGVWKERKREKERERERGEEEEEEESEVRLCEATGI